MSFTTPAGRTFTTCIFDLDETLYPRASGVMTAIQERIQRYMVERLQLDAATVALLRRDYYLRYGTALRGLQVEHAGRVDAEDYLRFVHDLDLAPLMQPAPELSRVLDALPLEKNIFTNANREHAERVLERLGLRRHFAQIVDLRDIDYYCKPDRRGYARMLELIGRAAEECIYVEDTARNLPPAQELGMLTVLVDPSGAECAGFDYCVAAVAQIGEVVADLRAGRAQAKEGGRHVE